MRGMEEVVDASVIVKWFVEEENSDKAIRLRDEYIDGKIRISAPELLLFEVLNALYYKRLFSEEEMMKIAEALEAYSFSLYPLKGKYAEETLKIMYNNDITVYDASYLALAVLNNTHFYTADRKLIKKLKKEYLKYVKSIDEV